MVPPVSCSINLGNTGIINPRPVTSISNVIKIKLIAALRGGFIYIIKRVQSWSFCVKPEMQDLLFILKFGKRNVFTGKLPIWILDWYFCFRSWQATGILFYWTVLLNLIAK